LQAKPHVAPSQVGTALAGAVQGVHDEPQVAGLLLLAQAPLQLWKLALQAKPQAPPAQVGVALGGAAQTLPHEPQLVTSVFRLWQPPAQKVVGGVQTLAQVPPEHAVPAGHTLPQAPQCELLVASVVSQPLPALPSQLPNPASQAPSPQAPPAQAGLPWARGGHALPHVPQWARLVDRLASQPVAASWSQSPKPELQAPSPHTPPPQVALALAGRGHAVGQLPQWSTATCRLVSQPVAASPSQSP
jgi:hypothetical protein